MRLNLIFLTFVVVLCAIALIEDVNAAGKPKKKNAAQKNGAAGGNKAAAHPPGASPKGTPGKAKKTPKPVGGAAKPGKNLLNKNLTKFKAKGSKILKQAAKVKTDLKAAKKAGKPEDVKKGHVEKLGALKQKHVALKQKLDQGLKDRKAAKAVLEAIPAEKRTVKHENQLENLNTKIGQIEEQQKLHEEAHKEMFEDEDYGFPAVPQQPVEDSPLSSAYADSEEIYSNRSYGGESEGLSSGFGSDETDPIPEVNSSYKSPELLSEADEYKIAEDAKMAAIDDDKMDNFV